MRKEFHEYGKDLDKFKLNFFHSKWPLDKKTYLCQAKTTQDYEKHNLKAKNIALEDEIGPQRCRAVLNLNKLDEQYLMNV